MKNSLEIKESEKGEILEFVGVLAFIFFVFTWYIGGTLIGWSQIVADLAAIAAVEEATVLRGDNFYSPQFGSMMFQDTTSKISGSSAAAAIGSPAFFPKPTNRFVEVSVVGGIDWNFGPLRGAYTYGGGGAGRIHTFFPGPPDPWE
ncbi:MAG: hypothetical protein PVI99_01270 [Anaerolineales bacterium]|jgi:hypothetical protein